MAKEIHELIDNFAKFRRVRVQKVHLRHRRLFLARGAVELVARHIWGLLSIMLLGNQFVFVLEDRGSKLRDVIPVSKTTTLNTALTAIDNFIMPYGIRLTEYALRNPQLRLLL